jgi:GAF domain-containing protein/anti-sigma regulatory factor (Ser/Thr protein kinase)
MAGKLEESYAGLERKVEERTQELSEALAQQTATADVLKAISRSTFDLTTVLQVLIENATRLAGANQGFIFRFDGQFARLAFSYNAPPAYAALIETTSILPGRDSLVGRTLMERRPVHIPDVLVDEEFTWHEAQRLGGFRSMLGVPMLREGNLIGVIAMWSDDVKPFTDKQIELVTTFSDQAVIAIENVRLFEEVQARTAELQEALEQQTATADILAVISSSQAQLTPVFETIVERTTRICEAAFACVALFEGQALRFAAVSGAAADAEFFRPERLHQPDGCPYVVPLARARTTVQTPDLRAEKGYLENDPFYVTAVEVGEARTALRVPLLKDGMVLGQVWAFRQEVRPFSDKQVELIGNFAKQAVIAIENARLFEAELARTRELQESLEYQTATSDVLGVISRAPSELQPVFEAIVRTATRLCHAEFAIVFRLGEDGKYHPVANHDYPEEYRNYLELHPIAPGRGTAIGRVALEGRTIHIHDVAEDPEYTYREGQRLGGYRTLLAVPLLRRGQPIGAVALSRSDVQPFTDKQIELVETFADQAVIAIENVRLFEEVQARTRELQESLEYQTATSDVLNVISRSPNELQPVLDAIVQTAAQLCAAEYAFIARPHDGKCHLAAANNMALTHIQFFSRNPAPINRDSITGRVALERRTIHVPDVLADPEFKRLDWQEAGKQRTVLGVPLMRESTLLGVIILARTEVRPFSEKQIDLVTTFADQAVIAINNVGLFEEVQARTAELTEALEQQTATSEVLQAISRSTFDLDAVLETLVQSAARLCEADISTITRQKDGVYYRGALHGFPPDFADRIRSVPVELTKGNVTGRALLEGTVVHIEDVKADPEYTWAEAQEAGQFRTVLGVPLLRQGTPIGAMALARRAMRPFTERQIELVKTFADQAVIAIENARLFEEVQARTAELARSVGELQALGEVSQAVNSTLDLQTVLDTIVAKAVQLSGTDAGAIYVFSKLRQKFRLRSTYGMSPELIEAIGRQHIHIGESYIGWAAQQREPVQVADLRDEPPSPVQDIVLRAGYRALLVVPLLRSGRVVGALVVRRRTPGEFPRSTLELLQTFAAQSVLAIQNARLFSEIEEKSREIEIASRHKSQFLANMSHELRTPMNAVLGFTEMMADGLYGQLPEKALKALERVQANGKHLLGLINDVLDLSKIEAGQLTLALEDYAVGQVVQSVLSGTESLAKAKGLSLTASVAQGLPLGRGDERRLTQVLLNLVGNAIKFTDQGSVEIRAGAADSFFDICVRDTGPGIAPEDQKRIFEEFQQVDSSSTRKKGGTGLGLAISKRLIEMHGGTLTVESVPGEGSTFRILVPVRAEGQREAAE